MVLLRMPIQPRGRPVGGVVLFFFVRRCSPLFPPPRARRAGDLGEVHHPGLLEGDLVLVDAVLGEGHGELVRVAGHLDLPVERLARVELDADVSDGLVEVVELELVLGVGEVVETEGCLLYTSDAADD